MQAWMHKDCATNTVATNGILATNNATNTGPGNATNTIADEATNGVVDGSLVDPAVGSARMGRTANRRDREAYNAYQREYMRKRRAR
jgi:hypothetical protein